MKREKLRLSVWKYGLIAAGFSGIVGQTLLLRGFETLFEGNEVSVGIFFASWLIASGLGAFFASLVKKEALFAYALAIQAILLPITLWLLRLWPEMTGLELGLAHSISEILFKGIWLIFPFAFVTGSLFTLGLSTGKTKPRYAYLLEALGAGIGGIFASLLLGIITPFHFAFIIIALNLLLITSAVYFRLSVVIVSAIGFIWIAPLSNNIGGKRFNDYTAIISRSESKYGEIKVTQSSEQYSIYQNGILLASYPDPMSAEEAVHFAMLEAVERQKVLLIGGGFSGALGEILKYSAVHALDYVEIDSKLITEFQAHFPPLAVETFSRPQVRIIPQDGRAWIKESSNCYNIIIISLPPPTTAQLNRFYTQDFFSEIAQALKPQGIFAFSLNASEEFIPQELAENLKGIKTDLEKIFPQVVLLPGNKCHFISGDSNITDSVDILLARMRESNISNRFISEYFLPDRLNSAKMNYLRERLTTSESDWLNRDFHPKGYFKTLLRWDRQFHPALTRVYDFILNLSFFGIVLFILAMSITLIALLRGSMFEKGVKLSVMWGGFTQMALQMLLLLGFQAIFGYLYYYQVIIIAGFMMGAAMGSYVARKFEATETRKLFGRFTILQVCIIILPFLVLGNLWIAKSWEGNTKHILALCALICGFAGGMQYSLGAECLKGPLVKKGGGLYALDLAGSALGALLSGVIIIPLLGFGVTAILLSFIGIFPLVLIFFFQSPMSNG
jgi:spermidine synthase